MNHQTPITNNQTKPSNTIYPGFSIRMSTCVGMSPQTRSLRSSGSIRSRSASELLLTQKTELPCLTTVYSGHPDTVSNDVSGFIFILLFLDIRSLIIGYYLVIGAWSLVIEGY